MRPCYLPVDPATARNVDLRRVTILSLPEENVLPVFTSLGLFWDFVERYPAEKKDGRPAPRKVNWFELADMVGQLEGTEIKFLVFDPVVIPGECWRSPLEPMDLGTYRGLMAKARPVIEEHTAQSSVNSTIWGSYPEDSATKTSSPIPRLKKIVDDLKAEKEGWEV